MNKALITPKILSWARQRANLSESDLARKISLSNVSKIKAWETGEDRPTLVQAQNMAKVLSIPFGYLFLDTIPERDPKIPDLRTVGSFSRQPSLELIDVYKDTLLKQAWLREHRLEEGAEPLSFVGAFCPTDTPEEVALSISETLRIPEHRKHAKTGEAFFTELIETVESCGITVLRSSTVGSNTHRSLHLEEFRGFAISDEFAPFVFINTRDAKSAQLFTLVHELAHIWLSETGISLSDIQSENQNVSDSEVFCNRVAAEALAPTAEVLGLFDPGESLSVICEKLSVHFRVSRIVMARRLYDLEKIKYPEYRMYIEEQMKLFHSREIQQTSSTGGPNYITMVSLRNSPSFTRTVVLSTIYGDTLYRDAAALLGVKPKHIHKLAQTILWT